MSEPLLRLFRADFVGTTLRRGADYIVEASCVGRERRMAQDYVEVFQYLDPLRALKEGTEGPIRSHLLMDQRSLAQTPYFNDFLRPHRTVHGLDLHLRVGGAEVADLRLWRGPSECEFSSRDATLLRLIEPVLYGAALLRQSDSTGSRSPELASLTPRELQVANLVAQGISDAQVAAALGLSVWTVRSHLTHSYQKLGIANRTALALFMSRQASLGVPSESLSVNAGTARRHDRQLETDSEQRTDSVPQLPQPGGPNVR